MKKILSLVLAIFMIFGTLAMLSSCDNSEDPNKSSNSETSSGTGTSYEEVETVAGKKGKEAYDLTVQTVEKMEKFDLSVSAIYTSTYNGEDMGATQVSTVYKSNGESYFFEEISTTPSSDDEDEISTNKYWYINNEIYSMIGSFKEKNTITAAHFEEKYMVSKDGLIFKIDDASFTGVKFKKINNTYVLNVPITAENYYNYTGVNITGNAECKMVFDGNANIISFCIVAGYDRGDGIVLYVDREITFNSIGKDVVIDPPVNASEFRVAPTMDSLDMSTLATKDNLVETAEKTNLVKMTTNYGDIIIRLYPEVAPVTVENFKDLVSQKFYDGLTFNRVKENTLIQGGDPNGNGTGGSGKTIVGEFEYNGFTNNLLHKRGVISMARLELYDSASSQFFIVNQDNLYWDGQYATFGYVVYGMDVVDALTALETDEYEKPTTEAKIISVRFVK